MWPVIVWCGRAEIECAREQCERKGADAERELYAATTSTTAAVAAKAPCVAGVRPCEAGECLSSIFVFLLSQPFLSKSVAHRSSWLGPLSHRSWRHLLARVSLITTAAVQRDELFNGYCRLTHRTRLTIGSCLEPLMNARPTAHTHIIEDKILNLPEQMSAHADDCIFGGVQADIALESENVNVVTKLSTKNNAAPTLILSAPCHHPTTIAVYHRRRRYAALTLMRCRYRRQHSMTRQYYTLYFRTFFCIVREYVESILWLKQ